MSRPRALTSLRRLAQNGKQNRVIHTNSVVASAAGLRYVSDEGPGIRRLKKRGGFTYVGPDGKRIRQAAELKRIAALAVPPAWTEVWICTHPRGHLQATGRDAKGRKQYRYHTAWRVHRDENKFDRMQGFAAALPNIRRRARADLSRPGLPRNKVLATIVQLLEKSLIRVGNEEYVRQNQSFGLTTLRNRHVQVKGETLTFQFRGKSGIRHSVDVSDRQLARIVKQCRDLPGQELFQYFDDHGDLQPVDSGDINDYLKSVAGDDFTAKDFRTWSGTVLALAALREFPPAATKKQGEKIVLCAIEAVAKLLGNTRTVCRKSYVHPGIIDCYLHGAIEKILTRSKARKASSGLRADEVAVLTILRYLQSKESGKRKAA